MYFDLKNRSAGFPRTVRRNRWCGSPCSMKCSESEYLFLNAEKYLFLVRQIVISLTSAKLSGAGIGTALMLRVTGAGGAEPITCPPWPKAVSRSGSMVKQLRLNSHLVPVIAHPEHF